VLPKRNSFLRPPNRLITLKTSRCGNLPASCHSPLAPVLEVVMRSPLNSIVLAFAVAATASQCLAQEAPLRERMAARRDLEIAKTDLRYYWQVEYPRKCRELDAAIACTRAELENNNSLLRDYRPFSGFSIGEPFPVTVRNLQLSIKVGELRLNDLLAERNAMIRFRSDDFRVLSAQVYEARQRVVELETPAAEPLPPGGEQK
jgi:hypothetical protein